jgi:glutaredoxin
MASLLARIFGLSGTEHLTFTVYTRGQCTCCHKALGVLHAAQRRHGFKIVEVDVDTDPDLVLKYGTEVPVVTLYGEARFRGVINPTLLERLLLAERRSASK